ARPSFHAIFRCENQFQKLLKDFSKPGDLLKIKYIKSPKLLHVDLSPEVLEAWQQAPNRVKTEYKKLAEDIEKGE
ncbi:656_t:CDS:1, partial [Dentiscutata erythropus]